MSDKVVSRAQVPVEQIGIQAIRAVIGVGLAMAVAALPACSGTESAPGGAEEAAPGTTNTPGAEAMLPSSVPAVITERWISASDVPADLDSPQVWVSPEGAAWVIVTAKEGDQLHVLDGDTGAELRRVGSEGAGPGQLDRPNGIAIWGDYAVVVERDNQRVQVFSLPDFQSVGTFGESELTYPYGIATVPGDGELRLWITDDYQVDPAAPDYSRRVHEYRIRIGPDGIEHQYVHAFGDGPGSAALEVVETIWVDGENDVLLIADETAKSHRAFTLDGTFSGRSVAEGLIEGDPEGSALYRCGASGYWILTDQRDATAHFLIMDRLTFEPLGSFRGEVTANTDGIGITQAPVLGEEGGAVYALQDDRAISAFAWADVAAALGLEICGT